MLVGAGVDTRRGRCRQRSGAGAEPASVYCQVIIAAIFEAIVRDRTKALTEITGAIVRDHMVDCVLDPTEITGAIVRDLKVDRELDPTEITGAIAR